MADGTMENGGMTDYAAALAAPGTEAGATSAPLPNAAAAGADAAAVPVNGPTRLAAAGLTPEEIEGVNRLTRARALDAALLRFHRSPDAADEQKASAWYDRYVKERYGLESGREAFAPGRRPFASAAEYGGALVDVVRRGYAALATPEDRAWMAARADGNREEMMRLAGVSRKKVRVRNWAALANEFDSGADAAEGVDKTDEEIDGELAAHDKGVVYRNFAAHLRALGHDFGEAEMSLVSAALKGGDGLPPEREADLAAVFRQDPEKGARLARAIDLSRRDEGRWWRDNVADPFWRDGFVRIFQNAARAVADGAAPDIEATAFYRTVHGSADSGRHWWNDAERAEYARLCEGAAEPSAAVFFDPALTGARTYMTREDAKAAVDRMCARRLAAEALPKEERQRRRREEMMIEDAVRHRAAADYGYWSRAVAGAVSSVPYMAVAAAPGGVGFAVNTLAQFETVRDEVLAQGGDPDEALAAQLGVACVWSAVEKMEAAAAFGKPLTGLRRKVAAARIAAAPGFRAKLAKFGAELALPTAKETLAVTVAESIEEGLQGALEGGTKEALLSGDWKKTARAAAAQAAEDFWQSLGSMGIIAAAGTWFKAARAHSAAVDGASLADFAAVRLTAANALDGGTAAAADAEARKAAPARVKRLLDEAAGVWERAESPAAALDEISEKTGLEGEALRHVADYLDMRGALLAAAREETDAGRAFALAEYAGAAFPVGGRGARFDPRALYAAVLPGATVEDVEIPAAPAPAAEGTAAGAEAGTDAVNPNLRADIAAALNTDREKGEVAKGGKRVVFGRSRRLFGALGLPNGEIYTKAYTLRKIARNHGLTAEQMSSALDYIESPAAVFDDNGAGYIFLTDALAPDEDGKTAPVMFYLRPDGDGKYIASAYARREKAESKYTNLANAGKVLYWDKDKIARLPLRGEAQSSLSTFSAGDSVVTPEGMTEGIVPNGGAARKGAGEGTGRRTVQKVTLPGGASYLIERDDAAPDVHTPAFAASVAQAVSGLEGAVTAEQYLAMTPEEREEYLRKFDLREGGSMRVLDAAGREVLGADAVVTIKRGYRGFVRRGGNWELAHEHSHVISALARRGMTEERKETMRRLFGDPRPGVDEEWNEEAAGDAFAEWLRGRHDFRRSSRAERRARMGWFRRALDTVKGLFLLTGEEPPVAPAERDARGRAAEAAFGALVNGDFSGLDAHAGIRFDGGEVKAEKSAEAEEGAEAGTDADEAGTADTDGEDETDAATDGGEESGGLRAENAELRRRLAELQARAAADPDAAADSLPVRTGGTLTISTPNYAMHVEAEMTWAPLADLRESTADREVQMRDRSRRATDKQVHELTRPGVFYPLALFPSAKSDDGAPVVGGGLNIISGHGRKRMLDTLAAEGRFDEYLDAVEAECRRRGLPAAPAGMENPVLVSRVTALDGSRADLTRFAELSNRFGGLERSGAELAESDARALTPALMSLYAPDASGSLLAASNRPFMSAFLDAVGATGLTNADGTPTAEAALRVRRAMTAALFGDGERVRAVVRNLTERADELSLGRLSSALTGTAGRLLAMKRRRGTFDITADVGEAVYHYTAWRADHQTHPGLTFRDYFAAQAADFFQEGATPMQRALALLLESGRFPRAIDAYADLAGQEAEDAQGTFGFAERRTPLQTLALAERSVLGEGATPVTPDPDGGEARSSVTAGEARRQYDAVVRRYTNADGTRKRGWMRAPNGAPTNLTERQWVQVRTPAFKAWFGDWEARAARAAWHDVADAGEIRALPALDVRGVAPLADKAAIQDAFRSFGRVTNAADGRKVVFPAKSAGKMVYVRNLAGAFKTLFERSRRAWTEDDDGRHNNIAAIHNYVAKAGTADGDVYVRFTVREGADAGSNVHAATVSSVEVYKANERPADGKIDRTDTAHLETGAGILPGKDLATSSASIRDLPQGKFTDDKLSHFLAAVNGENAVSRVVDENGEPRVVWHGSADNGFTAFDPARIREKDGVRGFYFAPPKRRDSTAGYYGRGGERAFHLNIRNPLVVGPDAKPTPEQLKAHDGIIRVAEEAREQDFFNWRKDARETERIEKGDTIEIVAFAPTQIKSATDNAGAFDGGNADIRYSVAGRAALAGLAAAAPMQSEWRAAEAQDIRVADDARALREMAGEDGARADGTRKGLGFFGPLVAADGRIVTEFSAGFEYDGRETEVPLVNPLLDREEIAYLLRGYVTDGDPAMERIIRKGEEWGRRRLAEGRSPFLEEGEARRGLPPPTAGAAPSARYSVTAERLATSLDALLDGGAVDARFKDGERAAAVAAARDFHARYGDMTLPVSTGGVMFFAPSREAVARHGGDEAAAWAEYALHAVTNDQTDGDGKHYRAFGREKVANVMPRIPEIVAADQTIIDRGRAVYFMPIDGKHSARLVARPENGNLRADNLVEVTATYTKNKNTPGTSSLMPLARAVAAWTSREDSTNPATGGDSSTSGGGAQGGGARFSVAQTAGRQKDAAVAYPDAGAEISALRFSVGAKRRAEYSRLLAKHRPDLDAGQVLGELDKFDDPKKEKAALHWIVRGGLTLPQDGYKVDDALSVAEKAQVDPFRYRSPDELLLAHKEFKPARRATDPATVPELSDARDEGGGITSYLVQDDRAGQLAMRRIIDTHWGEDANPWCLLSRQYKDRWENDLRGAWIYWGAYDALPKRVAFKDGKLLAFMATQAMDAEEAQDDAAFGGGRLAQMYPKEYAEYEDALENDEETRENQPNFFEWLDHGGTDGERGYEELVTDEGLREHTPPEWWDRQDKSHPDLEWAKGGAGARFSVSAVHPTVLGAMRRLADGAESVTLENAEHGGIVLAVGTPGVLTDKGKVKHGMGLMHIVYSRMAKEGDTLEHAVSVACHVADAAYRGRTARNIKNRIWLDKGDVRAVVAKNPDGRKVITGYEIRADETGDTPDMEARPGTSAPTIRSGEVLAALRSLLADATGGDSSTSGAGAQGGGARFSVAQTADGRRFALLDRPPTGVDWNDRNAVRDWLAGLVGTGAVSLADGRRVEIGGELPREYTRSNYAEKAFRNKRLRKLRGRAAQHLDELIVVSGGRVDEAARHKERAGGVYYRREVDFGVSGHEVKRGYTGELVTYEQDGAEYLYDLVGIKDNPPLTDALKRDRHGGFEILSANRDGVDGGDSSTSGARAQGETRESVTAGRRTPLDDVAAAFVAARALAGKETKAEEAAKLLRAMGLRETAKDADGFVRRARDLAEKNRESARRLVESNAPELVAYLSAASLGGRMAAALDDAISHGAKAADPDIGARVAEAVQRKRTRDLVSARGFTAAQMMAELPVDLAEALFAVAEYEKTPEERARLEAERKKRAEAREAEQKEADEAGLTVAELRERKAAEGKAAEREPTAEEKAALDALMGRARFAEKARRDEEARKAAERAKEAADKADGAVDADADGGGESDGGGDADADGGRGATALPGETVRRIAPVFEDADLFAQFVVQWTQDRVAAKRPSLPDGAAMWRDPVAVRELKRTAADILRRLAKDALGSPALNHARNLADRAINDLESDAGARKFEDVRRGVADVYDRIHDDALRISRRKLVRQLVQDVRKTADVQGRFSAVAEEKARTIDAKTELWARRLIPYLTMSEAKLQKEEARLKAVVSFDPAETDAPAPTADAVREAEDRLAMIGKYGGMSRWLPGRISDAADEIMKQLKGARQAFEKRRKAAEERGKAIRDALVAAIEDGGKEGAFRERGGVLSRFNAAMQGNLTLEMQNLLRFCKDPKKRQAALLAVEELQTVISEASGRYRVVLGRATAEIRGGLAAAYGSAEAGIRHLLKEEVPDEAARAIFTQSRDGRPVYGQLLQLYATAIQGDYRKNAEKHGRTKRLPLMEETLTDADRAFHAWAVDWYARNRAELSRAVEEVTGMPVASPDALYCPARMLNEPDGFGAEAAAAWSAVPSALNRRVRHGLDFNEGVNFLTLMQEQAGIRASTVGYAAAGVFLRDTIAHHDVQAAARRHAGRADMKAVTDHVRDVLTQGAARKGESAFFAPINVARAWIARFYLSLNVPSAVKQLASMPVWANALLGGKEVGFSGCLRYLATAATEEGRGAIRDLVESDGWKARYVMGWSEETQNVLQNPGRGKFAAFLDRAAARGMVVNKAVDAVSCLWMAQGFYRDARARFLGMGMGADEAKRRALALTWSVLESGQQSGRVENMNAVQRKGGAAAAAIFQFKTAYLLQNNYLLQALREMRAKTPGAKGRFVRALLINTIYIPFFCTLVNMAWKAVMGEEPPDDESRWPEEIKAFCWSIISGVTAPMFGVDAAIHGLWDGLTGQGARGLDSYATVPAVGGVVRIAFRLGRVGFDLARGALETVDVFDIEEEVTGEKLIEDVNRLLGELAAPYRHARRFYKNRIQED